MNRTFYYKLICIWLCLSAFQGAFAQGTKYRYLILFKDKLASEYSTTQPQAFLSARAIARREKMQIKITEQDLPVNRNYINQVIDQGAQLLYPLKWINGAVIKIAPSDLKKITGLSTVKGYYQNMALDSSANQLLTKQNRTLATQAQPDYGTSLPQISQLGIDVMHQAGYKGENILISLLDDGFSEANLSPILAPLYQENRIAGTLRTDPTIKSVYEAGSHGTEVLGAIAGQSPGKIYGSAYKANFALAQTEESQHELLIEEANWLRGAEWADSLGTDILSSSLGYSTFDNPRYDHTYKNLDGKTTLSTLAALWASRRGIICTISAGNDGSSSWKYISSPADADSVLSVGAVDRTGTRTSFSSLGPSFDNRIKPDVAAMGLSTVTALPNGTITALNGTSFSAPLIAGLAAGLIQAYPSKKASEIMDVIRRSGNQSTKPDNFLGYGIPNFDRASKIINPILALEPSAKDRIGVYPNPASFGQAIRIESPFNSNLQLEIISSQGAVIQTLTNLTSQSEIFLPPFISGKYYFRFTSATGTQTLPVVLNL